jgi:hypothetical protein
MARKPKTTIELDIPPPPEMAAEAPLVLEAPRPPPHPPFFSRGLLLTGMAVACVVGAGAGLWARPAIGERKLPGFIKKAEGELQIVVGEAPPAPVGQPLEVMRADTPVYLSPAPLAPPPPAVVAPAPEPPVAEPVMRAPAPSSARPLRVTVIAPKPVKVEKKAEAAPKAVARLKIDKVVTVAAKKPPAKAPELRKVDLKTPKAKAKPAEARLVKTKGKAKAAEPKLTKIKAQIEKPARLIRAKLEPKAKGKPAARPEKALKVALAKTAPPPPPPKARAEPKPSLDFGKLLASLKTRPEPAKVEKAVLKAPAPPPAPKPVAARPEPAPEPAPPRPTPVQQARDRCDNGDPGETLVCQNPSLQMADRRLQRAYHAAEEAGVEPWRLQQQQRRWLAARTAAARDNPWAVRDVYAARIAELEDLSRGRGGY